MNASADPIEAVSQRLESFVAEQARAWRDAGSEAALLVGAGADSLAGGKRLRARFCLAGWEAVAPAGGATGLAPDGAVVAAAAALEVFHAAALVHDDLIDNSDTRRGRPAAHRRLEADHRDAAWAGDPAAFGRSGAILLGDLLVAWSDDLLEEGLRGAPHAARAREVYALMRREVTVGQFLDIAEEAAFVTAPPSTHAERALQVASFKSARYSVLHPLLLGAALAGAGAAPTDALSRFGHPLGLAFQLRDDVLGVFGDSAVTGKPSGDDLREGKRTVLVAYARERLTEAEAATFDAMLGDPGLDESDVADLQRTIVDTGALARVEELIARFAAEADAALRTAPLEPGAIERLSELARDATARAA